MNCPVCDVDMFVLEFEQVEIDFCYRCGGVWLDSGELAMLGERAGAARTDLLAALETGAGHPPAGGTRRCPVCRKRLVEVRTDTNPPIVLDRCPRRHGLWFDQEELPAVVQAAGAAPENVLSRFLAGLSPGDRPGEPNGATGSTGRDDHLGTDSGQSA